jgi:hypothetical protein
MVSQSVRERLGRRLVELDRAARLIPRYSTQYGLWLQERESVVRRLQVAWGEMSETDAMVLLAASEEAA